jgi:soluble lytic murein transglycosylase
MAKERRQSLARGALALLVATGSLALGCRGQGSAPAPTPVVSSAPLGTASGAVAARSVGQGPEVQLLLLDPRLAAVRAADEQKDALQAATLLSSLLAQPGFSPDEMCTLQYLAGMRYGAASKVDEAVQAFDLAASSSCTLAPFASLRAAQSLARQGNVEGALARAAKVAGTGVDEDARLVVGDCHWARGDKAKALPDLRAWLSKNPRGQRWVDVAAKISQALLDAPSTEPKEHAREAFELATRVLVEAPRFAEGVRAMEHRSRAAALLGQGAALSADERARQAQAWLDAGDPARATGVAQELRRELKAPSAALCRALMVIATAAPRGDRSADAWGDAIGACEGQDDKVTALYSGAKASATAKRRAEAIARFAEVESAFPQHRLADDARFRAALVHKDAGNEAAFHDMLDTLGATYPHGDMAPEALFRLALGYLSRGEDAQAAPVLDRVPRSDEVDDRQWATAGRAAYFRARLRQKQNELPAALAGYETVFRAAPLFYFGLMSYARMAEIDPAFAQRVHKEVEARDAAMEPAPQVDLQRPGVARALGLLAVSDFELAKRELAAAGMGDKEESPALRHLAAKLYARLGFPDIGHQLVRSRPSRSWAHLPLGAHRAHWEAAYPRAYEPRVVKEAGQHGTPAVLVWGIMREESAFLVDVRSPSAAYGLMQLIVPTAKWISQGTGLPYDEGALKRPEINIALGAKLLGKLLQTHPEHPALAMAAYNGGSGAVSRWMASRTTDDVDLFVEQIPFEETRNYVKRVTMSEAAYAYLYDPDIFRQLVALPLRLRR